MTMQRLNLPMAPLKLTRKEGQIYVHCQIRKKNLVLTPEEWVRQHVIHYLLKVIEVPNGLIASELGLKINKMTRRSDVVVYGKDKQIRILVECKAPEVSIDSQVLHQAAQYNSILKSPYLWLTNGLDHHLYHLNQQTGEIKRLESLPKFGEM
jgi:hypothetical protein